MLATILAWYCAFITYIQPVCWSLNCLIHCLNVESLIDECDCCFYVQMSSNASCWRLLPASPDHYQHEQPTRSYRINMDESKFIYTIIHVIRYYVTIRYVGIQQSHSNRGTPSVNNSVFISEVSFCERTWMRSRYSFPRFVSCAHKPSFLESNYYVCVCLLNTWNMVTEIVFICFVGRFTMYSIEFCTTTKLHTPQWSLHFKATPFSLKNISMVSMMSGLKVQGS